MERRSVLRSGGAFFRVAPPVHGLNIFGMVVPPAPAHSFRTNVVGHDVMVVGELFETDGTLPVLLDDLPLQKFAHLGR